MPIRRARPAGRALECLSWVLGLSVTMPARLVAPAHHSPSLCDLTLLVMLPFAARALCAEEGGPARGIAFGALILIGLSFAAAGLAAAGNLHDVDWVHGFRWAAAAVVAPGSILLFREAPERFQSFLEGIVAGAGLHLLTLVLAQAGFGELLTNAGLSSPGAGRFWAGGELRAATLANHPNATMIMISLGLPAALAMRRATGRRMWIGMALLFAAGGFYLTLSRAPLLASAAALAVALLLRLRRERRLSALAGPVLTAAALGCLVLAAAAGGTASGHHRFAQRGEGAAIAENLEDRWRTIREAAGEAVAHPLGTGWSSLRDAQRAGGAVGASHNGYLFAARSIGSPLALFLLLGHLILLWRGAMIGRSTMGPFAAHFILLMLAEDVTQGASLVFVALLLASWGYLGLGRGGSPRGAAEAGRLPATVR